MNRNNNSKVFATSFTGTIDALLQHTAAADADAVELEVENEKVVRQVMRDFDVDREQALEMIQQAQLAQVQAVLDKLLAKGLVEISGVDASGDPLYVQTEKGRRLAAKQNKT